ncbi:MAG: dipicolinate synthase subunit B [Eubacterium sp.]|nr:dipicolinate synthase subunit B [Eubacterium sp.]MBR7072341.1 dipicolinate synthase subunit B [Eubacterium sp.]
MKIGYCLTGSFCTFSKSIKTLKDLVNAGHTVTPVMSENAYSTDTRFGTAENFCRQLEEITGNGIIRTIASAEPIGPKRLFDVLCVVPCTGNTLAKLSSGIADTSVTMAVKSHLRNSRPVVVGVSTNDALGAAAKNIGALMNCKNYYFVPFTMDDCINKPRSMVCDFSKVLQTVEGAYKGIEPVQKIF